MAAPGLRGMERGPRRPPEPVPQPAAGWPVATLASRLAVGHLQRRKEDLARLPAASAWSSGVKPAALNRVADASPLSPQPLSLAPAVTTRPGRAPGLTGPLEH